MPLITNESGEIYFVPGPGEAGYVAPKAPTPPPASYNPGAASYQSYNVGTDNYVKFGDKYYKQTGPEYNSDGQVVSMMGYDWSNPLTEQQVSSLRMGDWGAIQRTITPEYNIDDGTMTGLMGAGLLFGGLGAFGGMLGGAGAEAAAGAAGTAGATAAPGSIAAQWAALNGSPTLVMGGELAAGGTGAFSAINGFSGLSAAQQAALANVSIDGVVGGNMGINGTGMLGGTEAGSTFGNYNWPGMTGGETGIQSGFNLANAGGSGITGAAGTIPGVGTLTESGMLIPASGGAAIPLSSASPGVLQSVSNWIRDTTGATFTPTQIVSGGLTALGSLLSGNAAQEGAQQSANAQLEAARIAADAAKFRPVGVTTRFGQSKFTKDAQGNVTQAGYDVAPDVRAMQDSLMGAAPGMLSQFTGSQATTAPMGTAAQRAMSLGQGYLNTDPIAQAQKYYNDQQAVMAAQRERDQANTLTGEFNRGTYGLATGGTSTGMMAANPRLEAMYNAQRQQDLQLAANATQGGMDYAKFGAGMVGTGGDLLKSMYGTQVASYDPYKTAIGGAQMLEGLGQNALDLSINMGKVASPAQSGQLLAQGMLGAAQTMQPANSYSPWGALLTGAGNTVQNMAQPQVQNPTYDPNKFRLVPFGS